jgi:hypothetical protein
LQDPSRTWEEGLDIAETAAFLLEAGELVAMRIPPTQKVYSLRRGDKDMDALTALITQFKSDLEPHRINRD